MNDLQRWLAASAGDMPEPGTAGALTDWFELGELHLPGPTVDVVDRWFQYEQVRLPVTAGRHVATGRGIAFGDHRRVAGVRLARGPVAARGDAVGEVGIDSWGVAVFDMAAWTEGVLAADVERFVKSLFGTYVDGAEVVTWSHVGRTTQALVAFTGWGSGGYPVRPCLDA